MEDGSSGDPPRQMTGRTTTSFVVLAGLLVWLSAVAACERPQTDLPSTGTFSILGFDPQTGELGGAVQSRVFSVGNGVLWAEAGVGAVATQAIVDVSYGPRAMDLLRRGSGPAEIIRSVLDQDTDPGYRGQRWQKAGRQFAVITARGEVAAYTGPEAPPEFADKQGAYCTAQGNTLGSKDVPAAMVKAFEDSEKDPSGRRNHLALRLLLAIEAGQAAGGDRRGQQSAAILIVKKDCGVWLHNDVELDLHVDDSAEPIKELRRLVEKALAPRSGQIPCYSR